MIKGEKKNFVVSFIGKKEKSLLRKLYILYAIRKGFEQNNSACSINRSGRFSRFFERFNNAAINSNSQLIGIYQEDRLGLLH